MDVARSAPETVFVLYFFGVRPLLSVHHSSAECCGPSVLFEEHNRLQIEQELQAGLCERVGQPGLGWMGHRCPGEAFGSENCEEG